MAKGPPKHYWFAFNIGNQNFWILSCFKDLSCYAPRLKIYQYLLNLSIFILFNWLTLYFPRFLILERLLQPTLIINIDINNTYKHYLRHKNAQEIKFLLIERREIFSAFQSIRWIVLLIKRSIYFNLVENVNYDRNE